jgi:hypothetical protein
MFKRFIYYLIVLTTLGFAFSSCNKEKSYSKIKFELNFIAVYDPNCTYHTPMTMEPYDTDKPKPALETNKIETGYIYSYTYVVKDGEDVNFHYFPNFSSCVSQMFKMSIYINDGLVATRTYYQGQTWDEWGHYEDVKNVPTIKFTYHK